MKNKEVQYPKTLSIIKSLGLAITLLFILMIGCSKDSSKKTTSNLLNHPKALANEGKYEEAFQEFNRLATGDVLKNYPELRAEATFRVAHTLQMLSRYDEAISHYNNFMTQFPDSQWVENALYARGLCYHHGLSNYEAARNSFTQCLDRFPNSQFKEAIQEHIKESFLEDAKTLLSKPKALANEKKYEEAFQEFNRLATGDALKNYPELRAEATFRVAHTLQMLSRYDEAIDLYNNFMTQFPDSQWVENALYARGLCYYNLQNYEDARISFTECLDRFPNSQFKEAIQEHIKESFLEDAKTLANDGKYREAYKEFNRLVTGDALKDYLDLQAEIRTEAQIGANSSFFKQVSKDDPELSPYTDFVTEFYESPLVEDIDDVLFRIGQLNFALKNYEDSRRAFEKVLVEFPESDLKQSTLYNLAAANFNLANYKDSRDTFRKLLTEFPNTQRENKERAQYYMGRSDFNLENYVISRSTFENFVRSFSDSELKDDAAYFIARSFLKDAEKKEQKVSEALRQGSNDLALVYSDQKLIDYDEALHRYTDFINQFPESQYVSNAYLDQGNIYFHRDKYDTARTKYEAALQSTDDINLQAEIQFKIGQTYYNQDQFENSIVAYKLLLEKYSKSNFAADAKFKIAHSHFRLEDWSNAAIAYQRVIDEHPKAANVISICLYQIGEAYFELATEHHESDETKKARENFEKALNQFRKILNDFPTDNIAPHARQGMMSSLDVLERKDEMERLVLQYGLISSMDISEPSSDVDLIGISYFRIALKEEHLKAYKEALESYLKTISLVKTPLIKAQSYYRRGVIYQEKLDSPDEKNAEEAFQILIREYSDSKNSSVASMVADAHIRLSELLDKPIPEERKRDLIDQMALGSTVLLTMIDTNGHQRGKGSGFFVGPGLIATNYHVVRGKAGGHAEIVGENATSEEKIKFDIQGYTAVNKKRDLVILKVSGISPSKLPIGNSEKMGRNDPVYAVGTPLGDEYLKGTTSSGSIGKIHKDAKGKQVTLQHDAPTYPGNSGGPLLNRDGEVIGIHKSTVGFRDRNLNFQRAHGIHFAIPSNDLSELLKKVGRLKPLRLIELE